MSNSLKTPTLTDSDSNEKINYETQQIKLVEGIDDLHNHYKYYTQYLSDNYLAGPCETKTIIGPRYVSFLTNGSKYV